MLTFAYLTEDISGKIDSNSKNRYWSIQLFEDKHNILKLEISHNLEKIFSRSNFGNIIKEIKLKQEEDKKCSLAENKLFQKQRDVRMKVDQIEL